MRYPVKKIVLIKLKIYIFLNLFLLVIMVQRAEIFNKPLLCFLNMIKLLTCIQEEHQQVKRKLKTMDEVMQSCNEPAKHRTYHVPPGIYLKSDLLSGAN